MDDLRQIKAHGIDEVMIGIETGDDEALEFVNKGYTAADIVRECHKLDEAGFTYRMIYLGGLLGAGKLAESAKRSAEVLNQIHPYYMIYTNVAVLPGTQLFDQKLSGEFTEATEKERLQEMRELINDLDIDITVDSGTAASSIFLKAHLPEDKREAVAALDKVIANFSDREEKALHARRASMLSV
ncbi:MAG: hypothetical protein ACI4B6_07130 [Atopobiaceae bacterium]